MSRPFFESILISISALNRAVEVKGGAGFGVGGGGAVTRGLASRRKTNAAVTIIIPIAAAMAILMILFIKMKAGFSPKDLPFRIYLFHRVVYYIRQLYTIPAVRIVFSMPGSENAIQETELYTPLRAN